MSPLTSRNLVIIGMSIGGSMLLKRIFDGLQSLNGSIVVIPHLPRPVHAALCSRCNQYTGMSVKTAEDGEHLRRGVMYIAPPGQHLQFVQNNAMLALSPGEPVNHSCPSIDIAMSSLKENEGVMIGILLDGPGKDGVAGMRHIKTIGGVTITQSKQTCSLHDMPQAAIAEGVVDYVLTPEDMRRRLSLLLSCSGKL